MPVDGFENLASPGNDFTGVADKVFPGMFGVDINDSHFGELCPAVAKSFACRVIEFFELQRFGIHQNHAIGRLFDHGAVEFFPLVKGLFGFPVFGNIDHDSAKAHRSAPVTDHGDDIVKPNDPPVRGDHTVFEFVIFFFFRGFPAIGGTPLHVIGMNVITPEIRLFNP